MAVVKRRASSGTMVDLLMEWKRTFPDIEVRGKPGKISSETKSKLELYARVTGSDYTSLINKYEKLQHYRKYILRRKSIGKLTPVITKRIKNGNIDYIYSDDIKAISVKYGIDPKKVLYITDKYGTMEKFIETYLQGNLDDYDMSILSANLRRFLNVGESSYKNSASLFNAILTKQPEQEQNGIFLYDADTMIELVDPKYREVIEERFGLITGTGKKQRDIAEELGVTFQRIGQIEIKEERRLAEPSTFRMFCASINDVDEEIRNAIIHSNVIIEPDAEFADRIDDINLAQIIHEKARKAKEVIRQKHKSSKLLEGILLLENLELPKSICTHFLKSGIATVRDFRRTTPERLSGIEGVSHDECALVTSKVAEYLQTPIEEVFQPDDSTDAKKQGHKHLQTITVEALHLSVRAYNALKRSRINTVADIKKLGMVQLMCVQNLGVKSFVETRDALAEYISMPNDILYFGVDTARFNNFG